LREDNADLRLTEIGRRLGVVDDRRWETFARKREEIALEQERLKSIWVNPQILPEQQAIDLIGKSLEREHSLADLLRRPEVSYNNLMALPGAGPGTSDPQVAEQVEIQAKYQGYIDRQKTEIEHRARQEDLRLPADLDYAQVRGLSIEVQQKLNLAKPETVGQASRVSGVTPAAISVLLVPLKRTAAALKKSA
jgi:tRNA uridine 5-carboxymethylaminomethyl modification enzyme